MSKTSKEKILLILYLIVEAILLVIIKAGMLSAGNVAGILNLTLILFNVIDAWTVKRVKPSLIFKIGITLFLLCDFSILFRGLDLGTVSDISAFLVWIFYIPAQVLIVLSYIKTHKTANANQM